MSRSTRIVALLLAAAVGLLVSLALARLLSAGGAERTAVIDLVEAEAGGDTGPVLRRLPGCAESPDCAAQTRATVARVQRPGEVNVLRLDPPGRMAPTSRTGTARIAWKAGGGPTRVQCVRVRREGNLISGFEVTTVALSPPIGLERSCP